MNKHMLENGCLRVTVADEGAELISVFDKESAQERIWTADPNVWNRHAPILFPFIGRVTDRKYRVGGREYPMPTQHGFARDMCFTCAEKTERGILHVLSSSAETLKLYPYSFRLSVSHRLDPVFPRRLCIEWTVENTGEGDMLYAIGGHPGFLLPENISKEDCFIAFPGRDELEYFGADEAGFALPRRRKSLHLENGLAPYRADIPETWIFEGQEILSAGIADPEKKLRILLNCAQFPTLAVWANPGGSFLCLEPWFGRTDDAGFRGTLEEKAGMQQLRGGEEKHISYSIDFLP